MAYTPPDGDAVNFDLLGAYIPPEGDAVSFDLGGSIPPDPPEASVRRTVVFICT